jgi:transposase
MTRPYSVDLRERVVRAVEAGLSRRAAARRFEVSVSFVIKLMRRWRLEGTVEPERYGGWKRPILAAHAERVHDLLRDEPDLTIAELRSRLAAEAIHVSPAAISRFLTAEGLTRKKEDAACSRAGAAGRRRRAGRLARPAVGTEPGAPGVHRRDLGHDHHGAPPWPGAPRAAPGGRCAAWPLEDDDVPRRAAARPDQRALRFDGAINGERFRAWVEQPWCRPLLPATW